MKCCCLAIVHRVVLVQVLICVKVKVEVDLEVEEEEVLRKTNSLIKPNSRRIIWQNIFTVVLGEAEMLELFAWHGVGLVGRKGSTSMMCFASRENAKKSI